MDFLKIRKKAKERARDRGAAEAGVRAADAPASPEGPPPPSDAPVVTDQDLLEGALAARLQGLPAPEPAAPDRGPPPPGLDHRFTTWRPGTGAPPIIPDEPERPADLVPHAEDFAVFTRQPLPPGAAPSLAPGPALTLTPLGARPPEEARAPASHEPPPPAPPADPLDEFFFHEGEAAPALPELAPAEREEAPVVLAREEFLTFLLAGEEYAVAIERVREVVRTPPITEVPRAPGHILGVVTVRGEVVAVIDPRRRLGLPAAYPAEGQGKVVIVDVGEGPCGLHVDRVTSVVRLSPGSIEPCPQGIAGQRGEYLAGIGREGDRLFTVLDLAPLLRRAQPRPDGRAGRADASP